MATISGGSGSDFIHLATDGLVAPVLFADVTDATDLDDLIEANDGDDSVYAGDGADQVYGGAGNDGLYGGLGNDQLYGGDGNDTLNGIDGTDVLVGGAGDDTYLVNSESDTVTEAADGGIDTVVSSSSSYTLGDNVENLTMVTGAIIGVGNALNNVITDNGGNHHLYGREGNDSLYGGAGSDGLHGESGDNLLVGGAGNDTYFVESATDVIVELDGEGNDSILSNFSFTAPDFVENLTLAALATDGSAWGNGIANKLTGNGGNNLLDGKAGNDSLYGGGGNDTLIGGDGDDLLAGGIGDDRYVVDAGDSVVEGNGAGNDTVVALADHVLAAEVEVLDLRQGTALSGTGNVLDNQVFGNALANALSGQEGNDRLEGLVGNDSLLGDAGNDSLFGGAGHDTLDGGTGADSLVGAGGNDVYIIDDAGDVIVEAANGGADSVFSSIDFTLGFEVERLTLTGTAVSGTGNVKGNGMWGNASGNVLSGSDGADTLRGMGGDDTLYGDNGWDWLEGGTGNDSMVGGSGNDTYVVNLIGEAVVELAGGGLDTVRSWVNLTLASYVENMVLLGTAALSATGNGLGNQLTGNGAANNFEGLVGADTLTGAGGADVFIFRTKTVGIDVITDFNALDGGAAEGDQIAFGAALLTGTFAYVGAAGFSVSGNSEARVDAGQVQFDGNGDGVTDITITLTGLVSETQLSASDFIFI